MKKTLKIMAAVLLTAIVGTNVLLIRQLAVSGNGGGGIAIFKATLPSGLEGRVTDMFEGVAVALKETAGRKIADSEIAMEEMSKTVSALEGRVADMFGGVTEKFEGVAGKFEGMAVALNEMAGRKIAGNEVAAVEAFKAAVEFAEKGDWVLAKLYCLNAINHAPGMTGYYTELVKIQNNPAAPGSVDDWGQVRNVLELGLYQVNAGDIPVMVGMLQDVADRIEGVSTALASEMIEQNREAVARALADVANGELSWEKLVVAPGVTAFEKAKERMEVLNELAEGNLPVSANEKWVSEEMLRTAALMDYAAAVSTIEDYLDKAEKILNGAGAIRLLPSVSSMVQTANGVLSQSWSINLDLLPADKANNLHRQAERIVEIEKKFNKVKSAPAVAKVRDLDTEIRRAYMVRNTHTARMKNIESFIGEIEVLLQEIHDGEEIAKIKGNFAEYGKMLRDNEEARVRAYQEWAVGLCQQAFKQYADWNYITTKDAETLLEKIQEIDPLELTPDTARLHNEVMQKFFNKLGEKKTVEWQKKFATCDKRRKDHY